MARKIRFTPEGGALYEVTCLVARPQDWPGVHCVTALLTGEPIEGTWFDRTKEWEAR